MWQRCLGTLTLCLLLTGCQLADNSIHNVTYEFQLKSDEIAERCLYEKLAKASWETVRPTREHPCYSPTYVEGYKDGYVDFLQFGGTGQPPFVPPKRFWGPHYRTPDGSMAVQDWFDGFRNGASAARDSGFRKCVTLHTTTVHPQSTAATLGSPYAVVATSPPPVKVTQQSTPASSRPPTNAQENKSSSISQTSEFSASECQAIVDASISLLGF